MNEPKTNTTDLTPTQATVEKETVASPQVSPKKKAGMLRWFWRIFLAILLLLVVLIAFLFTGKGQRSALEIANKFVDQLTFDKVEGSLQDGLTLTGTRFNMDGVNVEVGQTELQFGFGCVIDRAACVENIVIKDTKVEVDTTKLPKSQTESTPMGELNLPKISLKNLTVENVQVKVDEMDISLQHFHSGIEGQGKDLKLSPTELNGLTLSLAPTAEKSEQAASSEQKNAKPKKVDWQALKAQLEKPLLTKLDPIKLPLSLDIPSFSAKNIQIEQKVKKTDGSFDTPKSIVNVSDVQLEGKSDEQSVELKKLAIASDKGNVSGKGLLNLSGNYPLEWALEADSPELKEFKIPASSAKLNLTGELFGKTTLNVQTKGAVNAELKGEVQLAEPKTPLNVTLKSALASYPFMPEKGQDPLKLKDISLSLRGDLLNYQLDTAANVSGMGIPTGDVKLKGKGELTHFELSELSLNALDGNANITGKVDWTDGVEWQSKADLANLNTKSLLPTWAATLSGKFASTGYAGRGEQGKEWAVSVSEMDLRGNLLQKNLQLTGELTANPKTLLNVPNATLIYGENRIGLKGILGEQSDFVADIKAPNLKGLVPNLSASLNGNVRLLGKISEPNIDVDLVGNNIAYDQYKLQHLTAKGKITTEKVIQGDLELALRQFAFGDVKVDSANVIASGSEANHSLKLTSKGKPVGANLQISGTFDRLQQMWQGQLSQVNLQTEYGDVKNDQTIQISYNNKQINANISAHCWRNQMVNLCFPKSFNAGQEGRVPFEVKQFDLAKLQQFLEKNSQLSGLVNASGDAAWFKNKQPEVNVELTSNALKFMQKMDGRTFPVTLSPVKINANLAENNLKLKTDIRIDNNGKIVSDLMMKDVAKTRVLSGSLNLEQINLNLVNPLLSKGENVSGNINSRLTLGGTALSPLVHGRLDLTDLRAKSATMPFDITGGNLTLNFNGASSTLTGRVQTAESELHLEGDADWRRLDAWHTRVTAKANRFRVNIPSIAKVDVSPNIEVKATPKELMLSGNIDIPWARIEVQELPESAVAVSDDEVIMDGSAKNKTAKLPVALPQTTNSGMAVNADIKINIGDDVKLEAYGLKANLDGTVSVRKGSKGLGLYGQVNITQGSYASFGQDLLINKGAITFSGLPSQPSLNIEAIRNPEAMEDASVTAGLRITGTADSPEVKVFSNPSMPQDQALSYILTGRSLDNSGDAGSNNSIAAALIGMSLSKSSKLVGGVGSAFGITDLNVSTAGIGDNTKVVVSGSLTPKFKVKYGVGLFASLTELTLRYRLAPNLYLQWISSVNQAVDLIYRFEFD